MSDTLRENIARLRKARNLTQEALAEAAGVGVDTVGRLERGTRSASRASTIKKLARALDVSTDALEGRLATPRGTDADMARLRQAITPVHGIDRPVDSDRVDTIEELAEDAHVVWRAYVDGRHADVLHRLPDLLTTARHLIQETSGDANAAAHHLLSTAYRPGAGISGRLGLDDLAWTAADRAADAARESDTPDIDTAVAARYLTWTLIRQRRTAEAEHVAVTTAERIEPRMLDRDPHRAGVFGNLLFNAATAARQSGNPTRADDLLTIATAAAIRSGTDTTSETAIFGPRVAALQRVEHTLRTGDPEQALHLAEHLPDSTGTVPAFWESGHHIHLANAATTLHQNKRALRHLARARDLAPAWARQQPLATTTMRHLLDDATRRQGRLFADLATHYGVA
ncbi:helix-turn-helix transcriptional regulator [Actinokineospora inagensis]|uniref:helix-turn-helix transcriptional regulator n=1 Tax=Actinokineospora inagensis TaxID=103730 RepID=UPI00041F60E5|nr:helix-turn-helix transcriptional regulator [Actinokineospora inagensis]